MHRFSRTASNYAWALASLFVVAILVFWLAMYLLRDQRTLKVSPSYSCRDNIKVLIEAQKRWAASHDGKFASEFSNLYPTYISSLRTFQCPSTVGEHLYDKSRIDELCEYGMVIGLTSGSPGDHIFICDKEGNHKHSRNVGFVNGAVKELHENKFRSILKKQLDAD